MAAGGPRRWSRCSRPDRGMGRARGGHATEAAPL